MMTLRIFCMFVVLAGFDLSVASERDREIKIIKDRILALAESYRGQGDPDRSKQRSLETLVDVLLTINPQPPVSERLPLLVGGWSQVWGPYAFDSSRGEDPALDPHNIYQIIFSGGYYYNVAPNLDRRGRVDHTSILRGEWSLESTEPNTLRAQFTDLRRINGNPRPPLKFAELAGLSELGLLPGEFTVLPSFLVRWFLGGGNLREVYTDEDLRINFGSDDSGTLDNFIFVLKRVSH